MTASVTPIAIATLGPAQLFAVPSKSRPHKGRFVGVLDDGQAVCSCPSTRMCWHIRAVREFLKREARR